jgi:FkbM family methyltransferase
MLRLMHGLYRGYLRGPSHPAKGRVLHLIERLLPERGIACATDGDVWMYLHPQRQWERHLLKGGKYHPGLCRFMRLNLHAGDTVAIAGISFGQQVIVASRAVGESGWVVGVDPHPIALAKARENIALNTLPQNIRLVAAALGEQRTVLPISGVIANHVGEGSLIKPTDSLAYWVTVDTLPTLLQRLGIGKLDALFLDVIGFELPVLNGLSAPYLPRLMTAVVHPWVAQQTGLGLHDYQNKFAELGYSSWTLDGQPPNSMEDLRECQLIGVRTGSPAPAWLECDSEIPGGVWM